MYVQIIKSKYFYIRESKFFVHVKLTSQTESLIINLLCNNYRKREAIKLQAIITHFLIIFNIP